MEHKHSPAPSDDGLSLGSSPAVSRSPSPEVGRRAQSPSPELTAALRATAPPKKVVVAAPPPKKVVVAAAPAKAAASPAKAAAAPAKPKVVIKKETLRALSQRLDEAGIDPPNQLVMAQEGAEGGGGGGGAACAAAPAGCRAR
jgi:hypothetical protein